MVTDHGGSYPAIVRACLLALLAAAVGVACTDRKIEEQGESHRHLAAEWCRENCANLFGCPAPQIGHPTEADCRAQCEAAEPWDWTDDCGDKFWALGKCLGNMTCEGIEQSWNDHPNYPCLEEEHAYSGDCRYDEDHMD